MCTVGSTPLLAPTYDPIAQVTKPWVCVDPRGNVSSPVFAASAGGAAPDVPATIVPNQDLYLLPFDQASLMSGSGTTSVMGSANRVRAVQICLTRKVVCTHITINVAITSNGNHEWIGLYSADKNTLLLEAIFTLGAGTGPLTVIITPGVTLPAGTLWAVRGADQTVSTLQAVQMAQLTEFQSGSIVRYGDAANGIAGGHLPPSLGVITAGGGTPAIVLLEP